VAPHTANLTTPDLRYSFHLVQDKPMPVPSMYAALSNSFGFGGTNVSLAFRRVDYEHVGGHHRPKDVVPDLIG
jgi:3-oxoacyl-[acyl-carrier-protein] synthase II